MSMKFGFESKKIENTLSSKPDLVVKKFKQWTERKGIDVKELNTEELVRQAILSSRSLFSDVTIDEVFEELKKTGFITISSVKKDKDILPKAEDFYETEFKKLKGIKVVEDEDILKQLEENKFFIELEEKNIFKNDKDLDDTLEKSKLLGKEGKKEVIETIEHYNEFSDAGLIKGGREESNKDYRSIVEIDALIEKQRQLLESGKAKNIEKFKKIATIIERAIAYGVSYLGWYGDHISIGTTCKFDDVKRGTDEIFEIEKEGDESSFMGLGIDVTYRGLLSENYKDKFFALLGSIKKGYKTKIKYFKNHKGQMMKEFAVPKIVLFFNIDDVKDLVYMVQNIDDPKVKEEFKNSPQKFKVMNQMIIQCEILADFADKYHNSIFRKYIDIVSSIKELAWKNPEIKQMLDSRHEDGVSHHMKYLIKKFEEKEESEL